MKPKVKKHRRGQFNVNTGEKVIKSKKEKTRIKPKHEDLYDDIELYR